MGEVRHIIIKLETKSPLCLKVGNQTGSVIETLDYIPGSTVRGMFAEMYLREKEADEEFHLLFNSDTVIYPNLYIHHSFIDDCFSYPIPLSIYSCKYFGGFKCVDTENHGSYSMFRDIAGNYLYNDNRNKHIKSCRECDSKLVPMTGYYSTGKNPLSNNISVHTLKKMFVDKVGLDNTLEKAMDSYLYSIETISPGQFFSGVLTCDMEAFQVFENMFLCKNGQNTYIGTGKTRGLGQVAVRYSVFNTKSKQTLKDVNTEGFILDFTGDAILFDKYLRPVFTVNSEILSLNFRYELNEILKYEVTDIYAAKESVFGWNFKKEMPKTQEHALAKGTSLLFCLRKGENVNKEVLIEEMMLLQDNGLGTRTNEGYGSLLINSGIHNMY